MSGEVKDGGPAFPAELPLPPSSHIGAATRRKHPGMSQRDWFAGQALSSVIAVCREDRYNNAEFPSYAAYCSHKAYEMADAMIAERAAS